MSNKLITHRAIYTTLRYLGMKPDLAEYSIKLHVISNEHSTKSTMCMLDEIFHHEVQFIFYNAYVKDRYYGC